MNTKKVIHFLIDAGIWVQDGKVKKSDVEACAELLYEVEASKSRGCVVYKAKNGKWYLALNEDEHDDDMDTAVHYGPFSDEDSADKYIDNFSNPGGVDTYDDGGFEPPKNPVAPKSRYRSSYF